VAPVRSDGPAGSAVLISGNGSGSWQRGSMCVHACVWDLCGAYPWEGKMVVQTHESSRKALMGQPVAYRAKGYPVKDDHFTTCIRWDKEQYHNRSRQRRRAHPRLIFEFTSLAFHASIHAREGA
jgi:hypothetical protein